MTRDDRFDHLPGWSDLGERMKNICLDILTLLGLVGLRLSLLPGFLNRKPYLSNEGDLQVKD